MSNMRRLVRSSSGTFRTVRATLAGCGAWAVGVFVSLTPASAQPEVHTVRLDQRHQTIDHFAASDCWTTKIFEHWSIEGRERVADLLFSTDRGIGLSMWRFNFGAGRQPERIPKPLRTTDTFEVAPGQYDFTRKPAERWMLAAAKKRGVEKFLAFSLSGTPRMTLNGFTNNDAGEATINLKPDMFDDYARYLADIVEYFAKHAPEEERVEFAWISPINEPQWEWIKAWQEATRASNDDIKKIVRPLHRLLREKGLKTHVQVVDSGNIENMYERNDHMTGKYKAEFGDYVDAFAGDRSVNRLLGNVLSYHSYWSDGAEHFHPRREKLRKKMDEYPGWSIWQTEYCVMDHKRDLGMDTALHVARVLHGDLTVVGVSGWSWWLAVSESDYKDGLLFTDWTKPGDPESIIIPKLFWAFGNHSRFIRPGMVRVGIDGPEQKHQGLLASAYTDPRSGRTVIVYVNSIDRTFVAAPKLRGGRHTPRTQQAHLTSGADGDDLRALEQTPVGEPVAIPPRSVVTVVIE
jgi:O-glycosyl hydrolase